MSVEHAQRHYLQERYTGMVNCASMCISAILPFEAKPETLEAAQHSWGPIDPIMGLIVQELSDHGFYLTNLKLGPTEAPSYFFHKIYRVLQHEMRNAWFIGALIEDKADEPLGFGGYGSRHVIAVTSLHQGRKATIVDTAPRTLINTPRWFLKKVPLRTLDRRITTDTTEARSIALIGLSNDPSRSSSRQQYVLERSRNSLSQTVNAYFEKTREKTHTEFRETEELERLDGRTKRQYRLDRRMHDLRVESE